MQNRRTGLALLPGILLSLPVAAQDERIGLEWIFSDEGRTAMALPRHAWTGNDRIAIYDTRKPKEDRTIESFDTRTGRTHELVDADKVIAAMTDILEPDDPIEEPGWPNAFGPNGRWAVYEKSDDILLLDLRNSTVIVL